MANRKINELVTRTPSLSDLILVGDPSSGYSYKATVTALATIIETDIADGFVTLSTTQTISGAKTFSNNLTLTSVANAATTQTKFLTLNASNVVNYRTGAEVLADIGGQAALTNPITGTGTTNYLPKFTGSTTIGNSQLIDNGTTVFLGTSGTLPNVKMIISTTSQRALELNSTSGNALFVSSGGAFVMTVTNGTWSSQFTQAGRLELGGDLSITTIANATVDTDKFLVSDSGVIKYRTGAEVLSDIGGASSASISGTTNYIPKFTSSSAIGNSVMQESGSNIGVGGSPANKLSVVVSPSSTSSDGLRIDNGTQVLQYALTGSAYTYRGVPANSGLVYSNNNLSLLSDGGYISYHTSGGEQMRLTSTGLGIGITSPLLTAAARGNITINGSTDAILAFGNAGSYSGYVYSTSAKLELDAQGSRYIQFNTNGSERMRLDASGNLGLGTSSPAYKLDVSGNAHIGTGDSRLIIGDVASANTESVIWLRTGSGKYAYSIAAQSLADESLTIARSTTQGGTTFSTASLTLNSSGNLGLGTSSPNELLSLNATGNVNLHLTNATSGTTTNDGFKIGFNTSLNAYLLNKEAGAILFFTSDTERMRLDASGNLGLSVTPSAWGSPFIAFEGGDSNNQAAISFQTNANAINLHSNSYYNAGYKYKFTGTAGQYVVAGNIHEWYIAPSGTAGNAISFTQAMTLDASGRLGIGTTSPTSKLHITTPTGVDFQDAIQLEKAGGFGNVYLQSYYTNVPNYGLAIKIGSTTSMVVNGAGNVGIGTTSPNAKLNISGTGDLSYIYNSGASSTDANFYVYSATIDHFMIRNSGNVGIGTASPTARLTVIDEVRVKTASTTGVGLSKDASGAYLYNIDNTFMAFGTNNTERMRITSGGLVGIGTSSPSSLLHLSTANASNQLLLQSTTGTNAAYMNFKNTGGNNFIGVDNSTGTALFVTGGAAYGFSMVSESAYPLVFGTNNTERMRITSGGEVYIAGTTDQGAYNLQVNGTGVWGAGAYVNGSDIALKQNILPLDNSLELVKKMKPVTYTYKESYSTDNSIQTGFIAQDLQELLKDKNYLNGIVKQGPEYLNVAYQNLIPLLVKAIQEQQIEIENLKNK
jgi:hypothetical protein